MEHYKISKHINSEMALNLQRKDSSSKDYGKNDTKFLKTLFGVGRYIGVTPFYVNDHKSNRICIKAFVFALICVIMVFTLFAISYKVEWFQRRNFFITYTLTGSLWSLSDCFFLIVCLLSSNVYRRKNWSVVFELITQMEILLTKYKVEVTKKMYVFYLEFFVIYLIYILLHCYQFYALLGGWISLYSLSWRLAHFYMIFLLVFLVNLTQMLKRRYIALNKHVRNLMKNKEDVRAKLREIMKMYRILDNVMEQINIIFGPHLFMFVELTVVFIVAMVIGSLAVNKLESALAESFVIVEITFVIFYIISLVVLIMSCDFLEKSGKTIINTCYLLHESVSNEAIREQLFLLAKYAEQWSPTLSAAGFYNMNQSTLSSVFGAIISYLVIIIQFNLALAK